MNTPAKAREVSDAAGDWLAKCADADFDGHGNFASFNPRQRLEWLSRAADLLLSLKRRSKPGRGESSAAPRGAPHSP